MTRLGLIAVCLFLATIGLVYSNQQTAPPEVKSQVSKLVGKNIAVQWTGNFCMVSMKIFRVQDCDPATGTLCLSAISDKPHAGVMGGILSFFGELEAPLQSLAEKDATFWVHPSSFAMFSVITEQQAKEMDERQGKEMAEYAKGHESDKATKEEKPRKFDGR